MNHQPFEDWLLSDERLSSEQTRELQSHMQTCAFCAALADVNLALRSAKTVTPAPGFTARWQIQLAKQSQVQRKRQIVGGMILVSSTLGVLAWYTAPWLITAIQSPAALITTWIGYLVSLVSMINVIGQVGSVLLRVIPGFISPFMLMVIISSFGGLCLLWVISIWKFTHIQQGV